ncbi:YeiH family protein [Rhizobium leucaenae]|uniref:Putative integral membrane protein (TIGR00698 family) n=1 Tax=Rhizobium leucaenae TaxID=29450 RepID=A0A7W6ZQE3_9HYPH|nr:putative sulfate exporter family transporter [Rhizobium leucaenae]MBB4566277.1 putative integral membrane protein (TIGR00698 family) [Rhizobium leucaenae]MBB6302600.1 putative integral membrane protein (TIGR00698 family) [Rhizobium leucaenae]
MPLFHRANIILPGLALTSLVALLAYAGEHIEIGILGGRWIESLVLAIALGIVICTVKPLKPALRPGIDFSAKILLEIAIVLLGASISLSAISSAGVWLIAGIAIVVVLSIAATYMIGRLLGLPPKLATLIACGNSICGNSAIVAVAPVIEAGSEEIAAALAFTAVLGIAAVFLLPLLYFHAGMSVPQYGVLAGLTVYAVPQVLAATAPVSLLAVQTGTLVKLVRVLMLGPVIFLLGILTKTETAGIDSRTGHRHSLVPWFICGFLGLMALRSFGLIPDALVTPMAVASNILTVIAMAALGLSVNIRSVAHAGGRVITAATLSLLTLGVISYGLIAALQIQ